MKTIDPFGNESEVLQIGDLTIENRTDRVSIYGSIDITRDKKGLKLVRELKNLLDHIEGDLWYEQRNGTLPDEIPPPMGIEVVPNPFIKEK